MAACLHIPFVVLMFLLGGCAPPRESESVVEKPGVVVSIYPLADWVREVAGEAVEVYTLLPPGANPHTFEPTPEIAAQAAQASLRLLIGLELDGWAQNLDAPRARTLVLSEGLKTIPMTPEEPGGTSGPNPHLWLDPIRAAQMVQSFTPELVRIAPAHREDIERRSAEYQAQLQAMGKELAEACKPYAGRRVITMHNAYDYFLERCGLPLEKVVTPFPGKEPSAQYLQELAAWAREQQVRVIFAEPVFSPKMAEVLAKEIGGKVLMLDPLGEPEDPERNTYVKLIQWDLQQLLIGLRTD